MPNELEESFLELLSFLKTRDCYLEYLSLEQKLKQNEEILALIHQIKEMQKQLVRDEYSHKNIERTEEEYHNMLSTLEEYPLYVAFLEKQKEVNEMFQTVKVRIEETFDEIVLGEQK